ALAQFVQVKLVLNARHYGRATHGSGLHVNTSSGSGCRAGYQPKVIVPCAVLRGMVRSCQSPLPEWAERGIRPHQLEVSVSLHGLESAVTHCRPRRWPRLLSVSGVGL